MNGGDGGWVGVGGEFGVGPCGGEGGGRGGGASRVVSTAVWGVEEERRCPP